MFKLQPNPTFKTRIEIPVPGQKKAESVEFEFRHFTVSAWEKIGAEKTMRDALIEDIVVGWNGPDEAYSQEAIAVLFDNYPAATGAVFEGFITELFGGKAKQKN